MADAVYHTCFVDYGGTQYNQMLASATMTSKKKRPHRTQEDWAAIQVDTSAKFPHYLWKSLKCAKVGIIGMAGPFPFIAWRLDLSFNVILSIVVTFLTLKIIADWIRYKRDIQSSHFEFSRDSVLWSRNGKDLRFSISDIKEIRKPGSSKNVAGFDYRDIRLLNGTRIFLYPAFPNYELLSRQVDRYDI